MISGYSDLPRHRPAPHDRRVAAAALVALAASAFCFVVGENMPVGLLPLIASGLRSSITAVGLLVTGYAVVVVLVSAPLTHLTRKLPRRQLLSGLLAVFAVSTLAAAAAPGYWWLLGARVVTALAQAVFWSIVAVTAAGLFSPSSRGRALSGVFAGTSLAVVVGVPAATWVGQEAGWRAPFVILAGFGLVDVLVVAWLIPPARDGDRARAGTHPDARRYRLLVATTALAVGGTFTAFTYVSPFLTRVSGLALRDVAPVLLLSGVTGAISVAVTGALLDRHPHLATVGPVAILTASLLGMFWLGGTGVVAAGFQALEGFALAGIAVSLQGRVLILAPRRSDIASAWYSASFNVGIASGPAIGAGVISAFGLRATPLAGAILASLALAVVIVEAWPTGVRLNPADPAGAR